MMAENIGMLLRHLTGAAAFGYWQQSPLAGVFMYLFLVTVETKE